VATAPNQTVRTATTPTVIPRPQFLVVQGGNQEQRPSWCSLGLARPLVEVGALRQTRTWHCRPFYAKAKSKQHGTPRALG
jgi:hypothetical protein